MALLSTYSPQSTGIGRRRTAAVAACAGALGLIAGCSTGSGGTTGTSGSPRLTAQKAISLAASTTQHVTSMAATFSEQVGSPAEGTTAGSMQIRLKPSLLAHEALSTNAAGQKITVEEIVSAQAIWVKEPSAPTGKPWVEIPLSELSGGLGSSVASLLQSAQGDNPAEQTQLLAASKDAHVVGTQTIDGVQTTHYAGTFTLPAAMGTLSPTLRKGLAPLLKLVTGDIRFNVWIDAQHVTRKVTEVETVSGQPVTVVLNVTSLNQPVQVTPPPASQVTILPKSDLGGV
jgi:hypothetical protein